MNHSNQSGTRTFAVLPTFPCSNFSLASLVILNACFSKLLFTVFLSSVILFLRLTLDTHWCRTGYFCYHFSDGRSSAPAFSWTSTNTGPSVSALSTKSLLVPFGVSTWISLKGSSVRLFCLSSCSPETTFSNYSLINMSSITSSRRFDVFYSTFIGWPNIASYCEHLMPSW